jgi:dethiobiotin synthetase
LKSGIRAPHVLVVVTGTGTEVGKTWVTAAAAGCLRARGLPTSAHKPAQSFEPGDDVAGRTDAHVLARATGVEPQRVCPESRWYPAAMAPPMAAEALGRPGFTIADLVAETDVQSRDSSGGIAFVEGAGGLRSPLAADGDTLALANAFDPRPEVVVLVADAGLGTINLVRLCRDTLVRDGHRVVVYVNRYDAADDLHHANVEWLATREGLEVVSDPEALATLLAGMLDDSR